MPFLETPTSAIKWSDDKDKGELNRGWAGRESGVVAWRGGPRDPPSNTTIQADTVPTRRRKLTRVDLLEDLEEVGVEGLLADGLPLLLLVAGGGGRLDSLGGLLAGSSLCHFEYRVFW